MGAFAKSKEKEISTFAQKYQLTYPVGQENGIADALGASGIPETIFIARDGRIVQRIRAAVHYNELVAGIEEIIKQP